MDRILITGAVGQIGIELTEGLLSRFPASRVVASDIRSAAGAPADIRYLDITDKAQIARLVMEERIDTIFHLAALLSARGEQNPQLAFAVNLGGLLNVLEVARQHGVKKVIMPSTIGAFGPDTPKIDTPDDTLMRPTSMYGITKLAGELLLDYYSRRSGIDGRSLRFPGIISSRTEPGGGTTDWADDFYRKAVRGEKAICFLRADTRLPFMYMPDAVEALIGLALAERSRLSRSVYNVHSLTLAPTELAKFLQSIFPDFEPLYQPDSRQSIADSWPQSLDDHHARTDWDWSPQYDLQRMTADMLKNLKPKRG
ncbi:MAG TPA: NAD-dependent epimerase/dehydratase family protein [bacterium]|nr:NAD-dependent epimerase/dehydratase family protein [bacterium]HPG46653.1 NAD-dependent epimerase/dehydratase family protein [bacterium]HPM98814.1 NAD-dependent epimerase/dehydratase family protein [bacterium]